MDLASFVNEPRTVEVAGVPYLVSALTLKEWGPVQAWIRENIPGPVRSINSDDLEGLNEDDRKTILEAAMMAQRNWPPRIGSKVWFDSLDHPGGHGVFIVAALGKHQLDIDAERAAGIADRATAGEIVAVVIACLGLDDDDLKERGASREAGTSNPPTVGEQPRTNSRKRSAGRTSKSKN